jgi:hypothetical protein
MGLLYQLLLRLLEMITVGSPYKNNTTPKKSVMCIIGTILKE